MNRENWTNIVAKSTNGFISMRKTLTGHHELAVAGEFYRIHASKMSHQISGVKVSRSVHPLPIQLPTGVALQPGLPVHKMCDDARGRAIAAS